LAELREREKVNGPKYSLPSRSVTPSGSENIFHSFLLFIAKSNSFVLNAKELIETDTDSAI
jgi:hypothetical protein